MAIFFVKIDADEPGLAVGARATGGGRLALVLVLGSVLSEFMAINSMRHFPRGWPSCAMST